MADQQNSFPQGIELLVKKAAVDADFRERLLADPLQAAASLELDLDEAERMMLRAIPREQLAATIDSTTVPETHRRVFLKATAASILAAAGLLGASTATMDAGVQFGIRPPRDWKPLSWEVPEINAATIVATSVNDVFNKTSKNTDSLSKDFRATDKQLIELAGKLNKKCNTRLTTKILARLDTLDKVSAYISQVLHSQAIVLEKVSATIGCKSDDARLQYDAKLSDLGIDEKKMPVLGDTLNSSCKININRKAYQQATTLGELLILCGKAIELRNKLKDQPPGQPFPPPVGSPPLDIPLSRGIRPDRPQR